MLRNDLITLLGEKDNDNVAVQIGDVHVDVDGVAYAHGNIMLVLAPEDLPNALRSAAMPCDEVRP